MKLTIKSLLLLAALILFIVGAFIDDFQVVMFLGFACVAAAFLAEELNLDAAMRTTTRPGP